MKQTLKQIYNYLLENHKIAEGKFAVTLALATGVIAFGSYFVSGNDININILGGLCIVFSLISMLYGFIALIAKSIKIKKYVKVKNTDVNLFYYKQIIKFNEQSYIDAIISRYEFKHYKADKMDYDLASQVISTARVINKKYIYFNLSVLFLIISIISAVALVIYIGSA